MELFRVSRNPWGQEVLVGVSWDLIWVFAAAGVAFIALHMLYMRFWAPQRKKRS